jgi:DNA-binding XRE family transcriptional regulator
MLKSAPMPHSKPGATPRPFDFGERLAVIRTARRLSQESLARRAGVSRGTIQNAEASPTCKLNESTAIAILKAIAELHPPLSDEEIRFFVVQAGVDPRVAESLRPAPAAPPGASAADLARLHRVLDQIVSVIGVKPVAAALAAVSASHNIAERLAAGEGHTPDANPHGNPGHGNPGFIVKHPPVQREGFVEQLEVDYETRGQPKKRATRKHG